MTFDIKEKIMKLLDKTGIFQEFFDRIGDIQRKTPYYTIKNWKYIKIKQGGTK